MPRIFAIVALVAWILLLWPYQVATFMAACIACVSYPIYTKLCKRFSATLALSVYAVCLLLSTLLPVAAIILLVTPQAVVGLYTLDRLRNPAFVASPEFKAWFSSVNKWLSDIPGLEGGINQLATYAADMAGTAVRVVLSGGVGIAGGAFQLIVNIFLFILITLMCVMHADTIFDFTQRITKFSKEMLTRFIVALRNAIFGILMGVVFVAIIQGILCGIGFLFAGVPQPAFWGLVATLVAPIPFIGTMLIWGPISLWLWLTGSTMAALGLLIWAALVVAGVDSIMRPLFLRTGINASVIALILAILCGLAAFGPIGIFAGPVLVAFAIQAGYESKIGAITEQQLEEAPQEGPPIDGKVIDGKLINALTKEVNSTTLAEPISVNVLAPKEDNA